MGNFSIPATIYCQIPDFKYTTQHPPQHRFVYTMAPKRPLDDDAANYKSKKPRTGFQVGPQNLPDGTWRRKVIKIKSDLIHKAKVKKEYAKLKAREPTTPSRPFPKETTPEPAVEITQELHPERQAMLDAPREPTPPPLQERQKRDRRKNQRPAYFDKELKAAEKKKAGEDQARAEAERRARERKEKLAEREKFRKSMAKARSGGRNGQRKLGRESHVLLDRVKRIVGE